MNSPGSTWARLIANRGARWSLFVIGVLVVAAVVGPFLTTQSCVAQLDIVRLKNAPPSLSHLFGTDGYARDVLARVLCGARISLAIGVLAVVVSTTIGAAYGLIAGYAGGRLDNVMMRVLDAFMSIPRVLILIAVLTIWHPVPLAGLIVLIGVTGWFTVSRLVRAETRLAKNADYVASARALGASDVRIVLRHLLPNVSVPIIVSSTLAVGNVIALEAGLSYLGIGAQPPTPSWGSIFLDGIETFTTAWWVVLFPGMAIIVTVLAFNALGDALRDVLDPRQVHLDRPIPDATIELEQASRPAPPPPRTSSRRMAEPSSLLRIENLRTYFYGDGSVARAVDGITFEVGAGETVGLVGESGCGKSVTALSILRLVRPPGRIEPGSEIRFDGKNLVTLDEKSMRAVRGAHISMVFQEPMTALNPVFTIGDQIAEVVRIHHAGTKQEAWDRAVKMLETVGIADAAQRARDYPHQLSGGMRQRVVIAMALVMHPALVIADEPTTALDVTIQAQILELLADLQRKFGTSILLITHDLGVVAETASRVIVMYAGEIVEESPVTELFAHAHHPYTEGLLAAMPRVGQDRERLTTIPGTVPPPTAWPTGCRFHDRCAYAWDRCSTEHPPLYQIGEHHVSRCHLAQEPARRSQTHEPAAAIKS